MKKIIIPLLAAACILPACTTMPAEVPEQAPDQTVTLYLTGEKPAIENATRTYYDPTAETVLWSASGEQMSITYTRDGALVSDGKEPPIFPSCPATVSTDGRTATFAFTGTVPAVEGSYRLHGVYPTAAVKNNNGVIYGNLRLEDVLLYINERQYPTETSFDPDADVMVAISKQAYTSLTDGMAVPMVYDRLVTHGRITLTDLNVPVVRSVKIIAPNGKQMTGIFYMNILDKAQYDEKANYNYIILDYTGKPDSGEGEGGGKKAPRRSASIESLDAWFCTMPFDLAEGEQLTVEVNTATETLRRTITARAEGIRFEKNKLSELTVSMAAADRETALLEAPSSVSVAGTGGTAEFTVKTNLETNYNYDSSWFYLESEAIEDAADGCKQYKYTITAKRSHSTTPRTNAITITNKLFEITRTIEVNQTADEGDVVIGSYVGSTVVLNGVRWYPVNCGFDADHPYGLLYQWGRKKGQAFCGTTGNTENTGTRVDETPTCTTLVLKTKDEFRAMCVERYGVDTDYRNSSPDDNTLYGAPQNDPKSGRSWYAFSTYPSDQPSSWGDTTDEKIGNPCPEGWRLPTKSDIMALLDEEVVTRKRIYGSEGGLEFTQNGQTVFFGYGGVYSGYDNCSTGRGLIGAYWTSSFRENIITSVNMYSLSFLNTSYGSIPTLKYDFNYPASAYSVRCVQSVEE